MTGEGAHPTSGSAWVGRVASLEPGCPHPGGTGLGAGSRDEHRTVNMSLFPPLIDCPGKDYDYEQFRPLRK